MKQATAYDGYQKNGCINSVNAGKCCMFCRFVVCCFLLLQSYLLKKNILGIPPEIVIVWIQIRPDMLSGLISIQTVSQRFTADDTSRQWDKIAQFQNVTNSKPSCVFFWDTIYCQTRFNILTNIALSC